MQHARRSPKTDFLQIRVAPDDKRRMDEVAAAAHLDTSTWARQVLLQAVDRNMPDPGPDDRA